MNIQQNTYLWLIPSKEQKSLILQPGEKAVIPFVECLDGGFSYDIWVVAGDETSRCYGMQINEKVLYESMRIKGGPGFQMYGNLWIAKGEHMLTITNASDEPGTLEAVLITRNGGYIHGGTAAAHLEKIKNGADPEQLLLEENLIGGKTESREEREARLNRLYEMGFIDRLNQDVSTGICRCGVPMGGIGAGKMELDEHGVFTAITINHNYEVPIYRTDSTFFAAYAKMNEKTDAMVLQDESVSCNHLPLCDSIDFLGRFPRAELNYHREGFPLEISLSAFSSLIEQDELNSALPAFCAEFTLHNPNEAAAEGAVLFSMENLLGVGGSMARKSADPKYPSEKVMNTWNAGYTVHNREQNRQSEENGALYFCGGSETDPSYQGEYCMLCDHPVSICSSFEGTDMGAVWKQFAADGTLPQSQPVKFKPAGAMSAKVSLKAGETQKITFVFAWYLPVYLDKDGNDWSAYYVGKFGSAKAAADYMMANRKSLYEKTISYEEKLFASDLPEWLKEKLLNDRFPVYTCSIFTKDGKFSINEAPSGMMGCLGTLDQRLASQIYYSNFYPELDRTELQLFADIQGEDGSIPHDIGSEKIFTTPRTGTWSDLCSSFILQSYRHALTAGDREFLERLYPQMKRVVAFQLTTDFDQDGIPDVGAGHGTTYDTYHWYGCCSFVASLWLAELRCCMKIAELFGDKAFQAECETLFERAQKSMIEKLWTTDFAFGGFFRNYRDTVNGKESNNCFIAQLAGVWFADALKLGDILPEELVREAFSTISKRNLHCRDMKMMSDETTPEGDPAWFGYTFVQYDEAYYGCPAIRNGFYKDGMEVYRRVAAVPQPWNVGLTYFTDGKMMGLPYYMTNPASYSLIEAYSGFFPDGLRGRLHLSPACSFRKLPVYTPVLEGQMTAEKNRMELTVLRTAAEFTVVDCVGFASCTVNGKKLEKTAVGFISDRPLAAGDIICAKR